MNLDSYLRENRLTSAQFGQMSGIGGKQTVHQYRHGLRFPTPENLRRIREATNGAVTADDFVDQHAGPSPPPTTPAAPKPGPKRLPAAPDSTPPRLAPPKRRAKAKAAPAAEPAPGSSSQEEAA